MAVPTWGKCRAGTGLPGKGGVESFARIARPILHSAACVPACLVSPTTLGKPGKPTPPCGHGAAGHLSRGARSDLREPLSEADRHQDSFADGKHLTLPSRRVARSNGSFHCIGRRVARSNGSFHCIGRRVVALHPAQSSVRRCRGEHRPPPQRGSNASGGAAGARSFADRHSFQRRS